MGVGVGNGVGSTNIKYSSDPTEIYSPLFVIIASYISCGVGVGSGPSNEYEVLTV